jgi:hypothetical protein
MDAFERDFGAHQDSCLPHDQYYEVTRNAIMVDKYVEFTVREIRGVLGRVRKIFNCAYILRHDI